jgi:hypothetical protein
MEVTTMGKKVTRPSAEERQALAHMGFPADTPIIDMGVLHDPVALVLTGAQRPHVIVTEVNNEFGMRGFFVVTKGPDGQPQSAWVQGANRRKAMIKSLRGRPALTVHDVVADAPASVDYVNYTNQLIAIIWPEAKAIVEAYDQGLSQTRQ